MYMIFAYLCDGMRYAHVIGKVGLFTALSVVLFVGCKKDKDQKGPSLTVAGGAGIVQGDLTVPPGDTMLKFKLVAQKGTGKDDADLKDYTFTVTISGTPVPIFSNRPVPNGQSFTIDTTVMASGLSGQNKTYTFSVTDKNGKSVSKSFKITFQGTGGGQPAQLIDSLLNTSYTNQGDGKGTHLRYQVGSGQLTTQNRTNANANASEILFVYFYSSSSGRHSVISPAILRNDNYNGTPVEWDNSSTQTTLFRQVSGSPNFNTITYQGIINAYNSGTIPNPEEFQNNGDQRLECTSGRLIAFKQGNIYGIIRVDNVTSSGATLSVKVARP